MGLDMEHSVTTFEESTLTVLSGYERHANGYRRAIMIDHETPLAAVHMSHQILQLEPDAQLEFNVLAEYFQKDQKV